MSEGAPWAYQGTPQTSDTGQVKLFNPAQFSNPNTQQFDQGQHENQQPVLNGQPENFSSDQNASWNYNNYAQFPNQYSHDPNMFPQNQQQFDASQNSVNHVNPGAYAQDQSASQHFQQYDQYQWSQGQQWGQGQGYIQYDQGYNSFDPNQANYTENVGNGQQQYNSIGGNIPSTNSVTQNYVGESFGQVLPDSYTASDGRTGQENADNSFNSDNLSAGQGMSAFFHNDVDDTEETESNTGTYDSSAPESSIQSSLQSSLNTPHPDIQPQVSNESLQTVNYSTGSLDNGGNSYATDNNIPTLNSQFQQVSILTSNDSTNVTNTVSSTGHSAAASDVNQSAFQGQVNSTGTLPDNSSGSPQSDGQGLSDWEVVPPQPTPTLDVQDNIQTHSRDGSVDNNHDNVQFFIGSSKNSDEGSRDTPESFLQGQNIASSDKDKNILQVTTDSLLVPQLTSSPNISPKTQDGSVNSVPTRPPAMSAPPTGSSGIDNPFRKDKSNTSNYTAPSQQTQSMDINYISDSLSKLNIPQQSGIGSINAQLPSPIVSSSDEALRSSNKINSDVSKKQPQSPIMPRKESPFQPPTRRRTLSSQSNESIEEQPSAESARQDKGASLSSQSSSSKESVVSNVSKQTYDNDKYRKTLSDINKMKPPHGSTRGVMSPRRIESAFQQVQKQRAKHNMSPATTLWADNDALPMANILLAPAAPVVTPSTSATSSSKSSPTKSSKDVRDVLSPVQLLISSMSEKQSHESTSGVKPENSNTRNNTDVQSQERSHPRDRQRNKSPTSRDRHERGSSIDRELELTRKMEERERRLESENYRDRDRVREPDYQREDKSCRRDPRDRDYDPYYDRYRERRDPYYGDERYNRPRSRNTLLDEDNARPGQENDRPRSRQEYDRPRSRQEYDRPRSRQEYDRPRSRQDYGRETDQPRSRQDYARYSYYRDKYGRGYDQYDYYNRHGYYDRQGYYDRYYNKYDRNYYDDYYKGNYDDSFNRLLQFDYQGQSLWQQGYPSQYYNQYGQGYEEGERYNSQRGSRVHTPGSLSDTGEPTDYDAYKAYQSSRTSSRQGYDDYTRAQWDAYYGNYYNYHGYDNNQSYIQDAAPRRMTPVKHSIPHMCVRFGPGGQLVKVMPNRPADGQPATVEIHDLNEILQENPETEELKGFSGPLVRGDTHKNDVLTFCQRKAKFCSENVQLTDRDSAELIWRFLELMIKQNGTFVGTDVADLLLDGHEQTTVDYSIMGMKIAYSCDNLDEDVDETTDINVSNITTDKSMVNRGRKCREEITDRFRHLLLYGRKKDALEWAMKNSLWGHALFLASKMDNRTHANVMTRFANSAMKMNDPLQTLFQLMSCRQPAAVTCVTDEKWGDWRPHLAMILSNQSARPDLDRKCIMTLGDTLASKGFLHASHFCYIMAQVNFGSYQKKTAKMVLIGSNHSLNLAEFATNEAIQCTEIYEYAMSLGNQSYFTVNFQNFKFLYACRLAENGFAQEALQYCEAISRVILHSPTLFQPTLVKLVYELGNRLKYFDPQKLHTLEDEDPFWLQQLCKINAGFQDGSIQPLSGSVTPYGGGYGMRAASTESGEVAGYTFGSDPLNVPSPLSYSQDPYHQPQPQQTGEYAQPHGLSEQTQQQQATFNQYTQPQDNIQPGQNSQQAGDVTYQNQQGYQQTATSVGQWQHQQTATDVTSQWQQNMAVQPNTTGQWQQNTGSQADTTSQWQQHGGLPSDMTTQMQGQPNTTEQWQYQQQYQTNNQQYTDQNQQLVNQPNNTGNPNFTGHQTQNATYHTDQQHIQGNPDTQHHRNSIVSTTTATTEDDDEEEDGEDALDGSRNSHQTQGGSEFDYFGAIGAQQKIIAPRLRQRTSSETSNGSVGHSHQPNTSSKKPESIPEKDDKDFKLKDKKGGKKEGWSWWPFKGKQKKNEMILPDDKSPSIIWDNEKKEWVNLDKTEEDSKPPPPPPKDPGIKPATQPTEGPSGSMGPPMNKFSLRKGKGSMPKYVDVMNSKPASNAPVPNSLFNVMPSSHSSPAIFSPGNESEDASQETQNLAQSTESTMPSSEKVLQTGEGSTVDNQPPASMPMMFNPAQFQGGQTEGFNSGPASTRSSGRLKPGQRRVYPK